MNQSGLDLNSLEAEIDQLQRRVSSLLEEEIKEKSQNRQLERRILQLEDKLSGNSSVKTQLRQFHRRNLEYLDNKIQNHQNTLDNFKAFYEQIQDKSRLRMNTSNINNLSCINEDSMSVSYIAQSKIKNNQELKLSIGSFVSTHSRGKDDKDRKKQINVICQMTCDNCGGSFKPYKYYSHVNHCHQRPIGDTSMTHSLLLD